MTIFYVGDKKFSVDLNKLVGKLKHRFIINDALYMADTVILIDSEGYYHLVKTRHIHGAYYILLQNTKDESLQSVLRALSQGTKTLVARMEEDFDYENKTQLTVLTDYRITTELRNFSVDDLELLLKGLI